MFVNLTCDDKEKDKYTKELKNMNYITEKFKDEKLAVYGVYTNDIQGGEDHNNK